MRFQLSITLTEEEYLSYNRFHSFESSRGKQLVKKRRIFFICAMALLLAGYLLLTGWSTFSAIYSILMVLLTALHMLLYKKVLNWSLNSHIKRLKKIGKLPFPPFCKIEFYDDTLIEITDDTRSERNYHALERICVVKDRFILLYNSSMSAFILPVPQVKEQLDQDEFLGFLQQKCSNIEYY